MRRLAQAGESALKHDFDIDAFLAAPRVAHLATSSDQGACDSPVWFLWEAGALWLVGNTRDTFPKRLAREPRCAIGIVEFDLRAGVLRHVGIRGTATIGPLDRARLGRLLRRYLGEDEAWWNAEFRRAVNDRLDLMIRIDPTSIVVRDQSYFANASPLRAGSG